MSDPNATNMHWPTYALRAWMTALLGQMERARDELDVRVETHERELARLRSQKERSNTVISSLREAVGSIDNVLRRTRDSEEQRAGEPAHKQGQELQNPKPELKKEAHEKPPAAERGRS